MCFSNFVRVPAQYIRNRLAPYLIGFHHFPQNPSRLPLLAPSVQTYLTVAVYLLPDMQDFSLLSSKTVVEVLMLEMKMAPGAKTYLVSGFPRSMRDVVEYSEKVSFPAVHRSPVILHRHVVNYRSRSMFPESGLPNERHKRLLEFTNYAAE